MSQSDLPQLTPEQLLADQQALTRCVILPTLYLLSGAAVLMLKGERKDRGSIAFDLATIQQVVAGLMATADNEQSPTSPAPNVSEGS